MSQTDLTINAAVESFTGYDEIAISQQFGVNVSALQESKNNTMLYRVAYFVLARRDGLNDADARKTAMDSPLGYIVNDYFADEDEEIDPEEPDTDSGKGDSLSSDEPTNSPGSASRPESSPPSIPL